MGVGVLYYEIEKFEEIGHEGSRHLLEMEFLLKVLFEKLPL